MEKKIVWIQLCDDKKGLVEQIRYQRETLFNALGIPKEFFDGEIEQQSARSSINIISSEEGINEFKKAIKGIE